MELANSKRAKLTARVLFSCQSFQIPATCNIAQLLWSIGSDLKCPGQCGPGKSTYYLKIPALKKLASLSEKKYVSNDFNLRVSLPSSQMSTRGFVYFWKK